MKLKILSFFLTVFVGQILVFAQCESEPTIAATGKILKTEKFETPWLKFPAKQLMRATSALSRATENLGLLELKASAPNSSWGKASAEAAVLTVFVNGRYNQDIVLFAGAEMFIYRTVLGNLGAGKQEISIVLNEKRSAPNARQVKIDGLNIQPAELVLRGAEKDVAAISRAPFIYARRETVDKFSDVPLITYYEIFPLAGNAFRIRYTTIFTNEDGGTQTAALMARWGRTTDIEWVYEIEFKDGAPFSEIYQGARHETKNFAGKRVFGDHPLIFNTTVNNNFSDRFIGADCSSLRLAPMPLRADLANASRETVMDENAWTYRIMAEEAMRENRVDPKNLGANTIDDLRNYLFVETYSENHDAKVSLETIDEKAGKSASDFGDERLQVDRTGRFRIALRLPDSQVKPAGISVRCHAAPATFGDGGCQNARIIKILRLDKNFIPREIAFETKPAASLKPGENVFYKIKN